MKKRTMRFIVAAVAGLALTGGVAVAGEGIFANNGSPASEIIDDEIETARSEFQAEQQRESASTADEPPVTTTTAPADLQAAVEQAYAAYQAAEAAMAQAIAEGDHEQIPALVDAYNEALAAWEEAGCTLGSTWEHWSWVCAGGTPPPDYPTPTTPPTTQPPTTTQPPATTVPPTTTQPPATTMPPATTVPPTTTQPPATTVPPTTTQPPATTVPPTTTQPPATTVPPTTTQRPVTTTTTVPPDCDCVAPTDPDYIAAKEAFEAAKAASWAFSPIWVAARDKYLDAVHAAAAGNWAPELAAACDQANAEYQEVRAQGKILSAAFNAALEEWDRVRDLSKVHF